jgi:hypothetical protein
MHAIQNSMEGETIEFPLELFYLENENWYYNVRHSEFTNISKEMLTTCNKMFIQWWGEE